MALTAAAVVIAAAFAHREFLRPTPPVEQAGNRTTYFADWRQLLSAGRVMGDSSAPIKIIEFADFECPFCRTADSVLHLVQQEFGSTIAVVFVHYPLHMHRFAEPAARAAECAAAQGQFVAFHDLLYREQDSLGLKTWDEFAHEDGISDSSRFAECVRRRGGVAAVKVGLAAGQ